MRFILQNIRDAHCMLRSSTMTMSLFVHIKLSLAILGCQYSGADADLALICVNLSTLYYFIVFHIVM